MKLSKAKLNPSLVAGVKSRHLPLLNPGERRILPANTLVVIIPATNLPPTDPIKYWTYPVKGHPWPAETEAWADDVGVGLSADDVAPVKMPAFPVTQPPRVGPDLRSG